MIISLKTALLPLACVVCSVATAQEPLTLPNGLPSWAYNIPDKVQPPAGPPQKGLVHVPGSMQEYDASKIAGNATPPDWFPDEHPAPPAIVSGAGGATKLACGSCHLMSGQGHPESADLAGMPVEYLVRQMHYFKSGARKDDARMGPIAKAASEEDIRKSAEYFAAIKPIPWVKVLETAMPPKTFIATAGRHRVLSPEGGTEAMGQRIVEIAVDVQRTADRDPHSGFIAYVPPKSISRGEALVKTGGKSKTIPCAICHGDDLHGLGEIPRLAGLQPVYVARQLITMQNGSSAGTNAELMKKVVAKLSMDDIIAISAYLGSLPPR